MSEYVDLVRAPWTPDRIRSLRASFNWTQESFGFQMGVTNLTVSRWERGSHVPSRTARVLMGIMERHPKQTQQQGVDRFLRGF